MGLLLACWVLVVDVDSGCVLLDNIVVVLVIVIVLIRRTRCTRFCTCCTLLYALCDCLLNYAYARV
jgi:hypothetical protein